MMSIASVRVWCVCVCICVCVFVQVIEPSPLAPRTESVSVPVNSIEQGQVQLHPTHAMYVVREQCGMVDTVDNTRTLPDCCVSSVSDTWVRCSETEAQPLISTNVCRKVWPPAVSEHFHYHCYGAPVRIVVCYFWLSLEHIGNRLPFNHEWLTLFRDFENKWLHLFVQ